VETLASRRAASRPAPDPAIPAEPGLGPAPAAISPAALGLSPTRADILGRLLAAGPAGVGVAEVARQTGLHENTVREHLDALVHEALADRARGVVRGRGRPAWRYTARPDRTLGSGAREYAGLAAALAAQLARSPKPGPGAVRAGEAWGRELAAGDNPAAGSGRGRARRRVVELLDTLGFAPRADATNRSVRLTRCPLLEVARRHPEVVCAVHLGIARGILAAEGARPDGTVLLPFAEPGACRLGLATG
jgi:predicted ArsR family transcriptional regulator